MYDIMLRRDHLTAEYIVWTARELSRVVEIIHVIAKLEMHRFNHLRTAATINCDC